MIDGYSGVSQPQISLLDYLQQRGWKIVRDSGREEVAGLCPLHRESRPSFYVSRRKQVFYCHGCGRGGGLARLRGWLEDWPAPADGLAGREQLLEQTYAFYQQRRRFGASFAVLRLLPLGLTAEALHSQRRRGMRRVFLLAWPWCELPKQCLSNGVNPFPDGKNVPTCLAMV